MPSRIWSYLRAVKPSSQLTKIQTRAGVIAHAANYQPLAATSTTTSTTSGTQTTTGASTTAPNLQSTPLPYSWEHIWEAVEETFNGEEYRNESSASSTQHTLASLSAESFLNYINLIVQGLTCASTPNTQIDTFIRQRFNREGTKQHLDRWRTYYQQNQQSCHPQWMP